MNLYCIIQNGLKIVNQESSFSFKKYHSDTHVYYSSTVYKGTDKFKELCKTKTNLRYRFSEHPVPDIGILTKIIMSLGVGISFQANYELDTPSVSIVYPCKYCKRTIRFVIIEYKCVDISVHTTHFLVDK